MTRLAFIPALLIAGPALAHNTPAVHVHDSSVLSLVMGLTLIAAGIGAAVFVRARLK